MQHTVVYTDCACDSLIKSKFLISKRERQVSQLFPFSPYQIFLET